MLSTNLKENFDICVDKDNLIKSTDKKGVPRFTNEDRTICISSQADKLLESYKPLNIVVDSFPDEESDIFYVKDNQKNITKYSNNLVKELEDYLKIFGMWGPEKFCVPNGPYFIVYNFGDISIAGAVAPIDEDEMDKDQIGIEMATKFRNKYIAVKIFSG
jgi:hypothetical protein